MGKTNVNNIAHSSATDHRILKSLSDHTSADQKNDPRWKYFDNADQRIPDWEQDRADGIALYVQSIKTSNRDYLQQAREKLLAYAESHGIPIEKHGKKSPYSMDANLLHISYEGGRLEDPMNEPEEEMWRWTVSPEKAPDAPEYITITYKNGDPVAIDGKAYSPAELLTELNRLGSKHGIGRLDLVENRFVGMKSRGCYETPGGTIMLKAHRAIESITLDREEAHLKDELMPRYAKLIYNGFWFAPEREMLQAAIDKTQRNVNGDVRLKLYKGNVTVVGRQSPNSLFHPEFSTFEEDTVYNQKDAEGFIRLNALRFIIEGHARKKR
jgi:argininosuccinate synthase